MTSIPIFTLQFNHRILPGRVTIGKYDGSHACLTAATTGDKASNVEDFYHVFLPYILLHSFTIFCIQFIVM